MTGTPEHASCFRFGVNIDGCHTRFSNGLYLYWQVIVEPQYHDGQFGPVPDGTGIELIDATGQLHSAKLHEGAATFDDIPVGKLVWRFAGDTTSNCYELNGQSLEPGIDDGRPLTYKRLPQGRGIRLQPKCLFPPVVLDCREGGTGQRTFTQAQLDYFKANGNNVTVFIHGLNVPDGAYGHAVTRVTRESPSPGVPNPSNTLHHSNRTVDVYRNETRLAQRFSTLGGRTASTPPDALDPAGPLNGTGAHSWFVNLEHSLNRAAGFTGDNWQQYSRIAGITWSSSAALTSYPNAARSAALTARDLVAPFEQLIEAGLTINIIAHSLGNRVTLVLLNLLAQAGHAEKVDTVFMWQAAVPDNVFAQTDTSDQSPLGSWHLPHASEGAKRFVVLYSNKDNVLGGHPDLAADLDDTWHWRTAEFAGALGGAYQFRTGIPLFSHATGTGALVNELAQPYLDAADQELGGLPPASPYPYSARTGYARRQRQRAWPAFERAIRNQAAQCRNGVHSSYAVLEQCPLLAPILTDFAPVDTDDYVAKVRQVFFDPGTYNTRPALGYSGPDLSDAKPQKMQANGKLIPVPQSHVLFSHSGMRVPSEALFEEIYQRVIWRQTLEINGGFGRY